MTKTRTVGIVAAFIAACGVGGFIAGASLDERCRTDTDALLGDDTTVKVAKLAGWKAAVKAEWAAWEAWKTAEAAHDEVVYKTVAQMREDVWAANVADAVYTASVKAVIAAKAAYIEALTD